VSPKRTSETQPTTFGILIDGRPIGEIGVIDDDAIDIRIIQPSIVLGWVPTYTEHDARSKAGYTISEWRALSPFDRAEEVALYRASATLNYIKSRAS
jgi:hypothetical protein